MLMRGIDALCHSLASCWRSRLVAALSPGLFSVVLALSIVAAPRVVRGAVLRRKAFDYVTAAVASGASPATFPTGKSIRCWEAVSCF